MFKKIIAWALLITVTATVAVGGTLAYLTDRDSEANVFTTGNVKIDLNEDFNQGSELIPGVEIEKKPAITNTGKNDAWVWATVAVPAGLDTAILIDGKGADWADWTRTQTKINDKDYILYTALYNKMLAKDAETTALFEKVKLDSKVDINPEGEWYMIENGQPTTTDPLWNNSNGNPVIYVSAYAMQTENFPTVQEAYEAYIAQWADNGTEIPTVVTVTNSEELTKAVAEGATTIVLGDGEYTVDNCGGKTLTLIGSENAIIKVMNEGEDGCDYGFGSPASGVGNVTFNGVTIDTTSNTGNYKGFAYMKGTFNNCNFVGAYSLNNANDFEFNNCTFDFKNGYFWTWGANSVTFDGCTFNGNSKCILAHGSASTVITINDCTFAATEKGFTGSGDNTAAVEIDPIASNTYTINFTGVNTKTDSYAGWTRVKDSSTGHTITGVN